MRNGECKPDKAKIANCRKHKPSNKATAQHMLVPVPLTLTQQRKTSMPNVPLSTGKAISGKLGQSGMASVERHSSMLRVTHKA